MKVLVNRTFKSYSFLPPQKLTKSRQALHEIFFIPSRSVQLCLNPLSQNQRPSCPLYYEEYLNRQVGINNLVNEHSVDYNPSLSGLISGIHAPVFL